MRIRTVKPCFFKDEELADLGPYAMLLFEGLWCMADSEGRLEDRPRRIKVEAAPYFDVDADELLQKLHDGGFIRRYEANGERYIQVTKFRDHQRITGKEAETPSSIPEETTGKQSGNTGETTETTGREGKGREYISSVEDAAQNKWEEFCNTYPARSGGLNKDKARDKYVRLVKTGTPPEVIVDGVRRYRYWCDSNSKTGTEFVAQMTTWLNQKRWLEDYGPSKSEVIRSDKPKGGWEQVH
jgi:hypothetical protein